MLTSPLLLLKLRNRPAIRRLALKIPASASRQVYDHLSNNAPALRDLEINLAPHSIPLSYEFEDTSPALRAILQRRLESPNFSPIESLTLSEHLVGKESPWLAQNTKLTLVASDQLWSIEEQDLDEDDSDESDYPDA